MVPNSVSTLPTAFSSPAISVVKSAVSNLTIDEVVDAPLTYTESGANLILSVSKLNAAGQIATLYGASTATSAKPTVFATAMIDANGTASFTIPKPAALTYFRAKSGHSWSANHKTDARIVAPSAVYKLSDSDADKNKAASWSPPLVYAPAPAALNTNLGVPVHKYKILMYGDSNAAMGSATNSAGGTVYPGYLTLLQKANPPASFTALDLSASGRHSSNLLKNAPLVGNDNNTGLPYANANTSGYAAGMNHFSGLKKAISDLKIAEPNTIPVVSVVGFGANNASDYYAPWINWQTDFKQLIADLKTLNTPVVVQVHAAYSNSLLLEAVRVQALTCTQIARAGGVTTPTDAEAMDMIYNFYRYKQEFFTANALKYNVDGVHYGYPDQQASHGAELAPLFARAMREVK